MDGKELIFASKTLSFAALAANYSYRQRFGHVDGIRLVFNIGSAQLGVGGRFCNTDNAA
ncbi:hypothetical protein [Microbulbifer sp. 2205BS26-8]|uniref:hypothetical protein n=1 Tax=Microbulbifer sp. 2205BS26-8 TaxID=3064386 RepID=UPI00274000B0|nr:hypothetical protein [Microbulbifer sp. 2205BS26-8]MDP5208563.1 hypothetical protein [Microbulbifer sp. 2205BS26-8]